jgi:AraC-like DNA-binding protein
LIAQECVAGEPQHDLYGDGLLIALIAKLFATGEQTERRRSHLSEQQKRRVIAFIEEHCGQNFRLGDLAQLMGLSETHFSHAFKASFGVSPLRWHHEARIRRAQTLMLDPNRPLTEIATATGFADQAHFTRVFKRIAGVTPARWREEMAQRK